MRRITNARITAFAAALAAAAFAVYALRPGTIVTSAVHVRARPAEVRTQVIRRTIHIVRHEKPRHLHASAHPAGIVAGGGAVVAAGAPGAPRTVAPVRTGASGAVTSSVGSAPVATAAPVRTRTSAASGGSGTASAGGSGAVRTKTSGGSHGDGGHDD
jgi:hypothetical protein